MLSGRTRSFKRRTTNFAFASGKSTSSTISPTRPKAASFMTRGLLSNPFIEKASHSLSPCSRGCDVCSTRVAADEVTGRKLRTPTFVSRRFKSVSLHRSFRSAERETIAKGGEFDTIDNEVYGAMLSVPCFDSVPMRAKGRGLTRLVSQRERLS